MSVTVQHESARRVSACVTELLRKQPFFGSLALRLPLEPDPSRETLASDGRAIRYSPQWVSGTAAHAIEAAIARVVLACALKHHTRRGARNPERWQHASQLVTHALLRDAGFTLPPEAEAWDGMSVEQAYDRLPEPGGDGETPNDASQSAGAGSHDSQSGAGPRSESASGSPGDNQDNAPCGGNASPGNDPDQGPSEPAGDAPPSHDPSGTGEVMDAPANGGGEGPESALSDAQRALEEQAWDEAMHQAASLARAEGKLPGAVEATVRGAHVNRLDWRALLRRHMTDAAKNDYSWSAPNRRFIDGGLYLPSIRSEGIDTLAVIVDTSGSLPADVLAEFWTEVREIAAEIQPERIVLLQVDAAVRDASEYCAFDLPEEIVVRGRGGTDFRPGFAWLDERGIRPGACLYFTDMECSRYPETKPGFSVVWVNWSNPPSPFNREPWGERIDIGG